MFGWFKRKTKSEADGQTVVVGVKLISGIASVRATRPPTYSEIIAAKRRRAKARHKQRKRA